MAGMMPTSARPAFRSSAHCDGTANKRSYRPSRDQTVKPQTSGAVFRNSTMEMRSLPIFANARGQFTISQPVLLTDARRNDGRAQRHPTQSSRRMQRTPTSTSRRDTARETPPGNANFPIEKIETMDLTNGQQVTRIGIQDPFVARRFYDS